MIVGAIAPVVLAMALVPLRSTLSGVNTALILVVTVVAAAAIGGRLAGTIAGVMAAVSFNFFHTRPYLSLNIDSRDDVETAAILLVVGVIVGTVAARAHRSMASTAQYSDELRSIHEISSLVTSGAERPAVIDAATGALRVLLRLRECRYEDAPFTTPYPPLNRHGSTGGGLATYVATRTGLELPAGGAELPVLSGGVTIGRFVLVPTPDAGVSRHARLAAVVIADCVGTAPARQSR